MLTPRALVAAPTTQTVQPVQGTPVYGLTGTLRAVDIPLAATQLITPGATIYYLVGANPTIEQQLRQLRDRVPPVRVQVWGMLQANSIQLGQPQLVVTGILGPDEEQPTPTPFVITPRPPTVTPMPVLRPPPAQRLCGSPPIFLTPIWLDGHLVIYQWRDGPHQAQTVFRNVGAGQHTVLVEY